MQPVIAIDDHELAHSGVRLILAGHPRFVLAGTFNRARAGIDHLAAHPGTITLLDLELPDIDGLAALSEIAGRALGPVIVLTGVTRPEMLAQARELGAAGIVSKGDPIGETLSAIEAVAAGGTWISPGVTALLAQVQPAAIELSARQASILHLLAGGLSNKEIAYRLAISPPTVSFHLAEIRRKLNAGNSRQLVELARASGLLAASASSST